MAALNIAFDAPETGRSVTPSRARPIDLVHLANQTMGDKTLEIEVLQIFARQARNLVQALIVEDVQERVNAAHRLKGAALAVGAFMVADSAARVEEQPLEERRLTDLAASVLDAELFILKLCR